MPTVITAHCRRPARAGRPFRVTLGYLLYRSRYVPRGLGILLAIGGSGYIVHSLANFFVADQSGLASAIVLAPAAVGELAFTAWLLFKGVDVRRRATTTSSSGHAQLPLSCTSRVLREVRGEGVHPRRLRQAGTVHGPARGGRSRAAATSKRAKARACPCGAGEGANDRFLVCWSGHRCVWSLQLVACSQVSRTPSRTRSHGVAGFRCAQSRSSCGSTSVQLRPRYSARPRSSWP